MVSDLLNMSQIPNWVFTGDFKISAVTQGTARLRRSTASVPAWIW